LNNIYPSRVSNIIKELLTKYRISDHRLPIERGRYSNKKREERTCNLCKSGAISDELHFLFSCHFLNDNRMKLLQSSWLDPTRSHDTSHYIKILSTQNEKKLVSLAKYVSKGFECIQFQVDLNWSIMIMVSGLVSMSVMFGGCSITLCSSIFFLHLNIVINHVNTIQYYIVTVHVICNLMWYIFSPKR
jgi:hypothetical protein